MSIREFVDSKGVTWRVWRTSPRSGYVYTERLRDGWLTFESVQQRRRLAPVPAGWADATPDRLDLMCRAAEPVRRRSRPVIQPGRVESGE
jgi:hypothetical protein